MGWPLQELQELGRFCLVRGQVWSCPHGRELLEATPFVTICHNSPRNLLQGPSVEPGETGACISSQGPLMPCGCPAQGVDEGGDAVVCQAGQGLCLSPLESKGPPCPDHFLQRWQTHWGSRASQLPRPCPSCSRASRELRGDVDVLAASPSAIYLTQTPAG